MGKSDLVKKVGGPIHCWSRGPKSWGDRSPRPPWWLRLWLYALKKFGIVMSASDGPRRLLKNVTYRPMVVRS
jgi:hypothetical protein